MGFVARFSLIAPTLESAPGDGFTLSRLLLFRLRRPWLVLPAIVPLAGSHYSSLSRTRLRAFAFGPRELDSTLRTSDSISLGGIGSDRLVEGRIGLVHLSNIGQHSSLVVVTLPASFVVTVSHAGTEILPSEPDDYNILTVAEVAQLLKCKPSSIYNLTRSRGHVRYNNPIPVLRLPMGLRFRRSSVLAWLKSQEL
jgi:hypothetical protein